MDLYRHSIEVILSNQTPGGAYVACPYFPSYRYTWYRDGAYTAYAMDMAGQTDSARRFHDWAAAAILDRGELICRAVDKAGRGLPLDEGETLHTRYTLDGKEGTTQKWENFQLDGFGTWLWALEQHLLTTGQPLPENWTRAGELLAGYLAALWKLPCYDCWEEFRDKIHTYTLASIWAGLGAWERLSGCAQPAKEAIREFIDTRLVYDGYFVKFEGSYTVDASLLGLAVPYGLVSPDDPRMAATLERIKRSLLYAGGLHRYPTDTYYGGGVWVLLGGWLAWYFARSGNSARAAELLAWMESRADERGDLPEQVPDDLVDPNYYLPWERKWGPIARPLLWSHAEYIIVRQLLK